MNPMMQQKIQQMMGNPQFQAQYQQKLRGLNPTQVLSQIRNNPQAMNIPIVQNVIKNLDENNTDGLMEIANNVFREKGQNFSEFEKNAKQYLGFN